MFTENKYVSMSIAGFDPSGGAGIMADLKSFTANDVYATCVITTLTSQNPLVVNKISKVELDFIESQIDTIMDVYPIKYVKTGVLYSEDIVKLVDCKIKEYDLKCVVDPVMISESGCSLAGDDFSTSLSKYLLKDTYLITPNITEAEKLTQIPIECEDDMIEAALKLNKKCSCVITGGHMNGNDIIAINNKITKVKGCIIPSENTHGTGCNYSTAITANLIKGNNIIESCIKANKFIQKSIKNGFFMTPYQF